MLIRFYRFINTIRSSPARKSNLILIPSLLALLVNVLIWILIYFKFRPLVINLPPEEAFVPLHYNIYLGVDSFGLWQKIFLLPLFGAGVLFLNTLLAFVVYNRKEIISYFFSFSSLLIQIALFFATALIILINI